MLLKLICRHVDCQAREEHKKLFMLLKLVGRRNATTSTLTPLPLCGPPLAAATVHLMSMPNLYKQRERGEGGGGMSLREKCPDDSS